MTSREAALQARVDELEAYVAELRRHPAMMADLLGITETHARILRALRAASPKRLLQNDIEQMIFPTRAVSYHLVHVHISKMRRKLAEHGIAVDSTHGGYEKPGWGLTPEMVTRLDALLEERSAGLVGSAA